MSSKEIDFAPPDDLFDADGALTAEFLLSRGYCCGNGCRNCPYVPRHGGLDARPPAVPFSGEDAAAPGG